MRRDDARDQERLEVVQVLETLVDERGPDRKGLDRHALRKAELLSQTALAARRHSPQSWPAPSV